MSSDDTNYAAPNADGIDLSPLSLESKTETASGSGSRCLALNSSAPSAYGSKSEIRLALAEDEVVVDLSVDDEVAIIFSFLQPKAIMRARVCTTWRDAAKKTIVPLCDFAVKDATSYNTMSAMSTALPQLQQLKIRPLSATKYTDGEDPDEEWAAETANYRTQHDIYVISNFSKLRILRINGAPLNGRYPALFNFPLLEQLTIVNCLFLKWDLEMLSGFPLLKELDCDYVPYPTGNLSSLRPLKDTLEKVSITDCRSIQGNLMDLADFPRLRELDLQGTAVTGDIRDIRPDDFPAIEKLILPSTVAGGIDYQFQRISDVPTFMQAIYPLLKRTPSLLKYWKNTYNSDYGCRWALSRSSPDWHNHELYIEETTPSPPFRLEFAQAGSRLGWCWYARNNVEVEHEWHYHYCEINWLDPEPSISISSDYETYTEALQRIERYVHFYKGYHEPPSEEEYIRRHCVDLVERIRRRPVV